MSINTEFHACLNAAYKKAESLVIEDKEVDFHQEPCVTACIALAKLDHASRGAALTLLCYKLVCPNQDIRAHKSEYANGFSARSIDNKITVPFLIEKSLPRNVETHWLTQTLSFAPVLNADVVLKTQPKNSGPLLIEVVNYGQNIDPQRLEAMVIAIFVELIKIRNKDKVILTRPKNLPIFAVQELLYKHFFANKYKRNAPRLPQIAIYAIYKSIVGKVFRFQGQQLDKLQRMKSADRKSGTVGDIVVLKDGLPTEAVEIKFGQPIIENHILEAIEKVRGATVSRYYLLSTHGISTGEKEAIQFKQADFLKQNGCEIIVNGVIETIGYYLRLLPDTTEFLATYATLLEIDEDTAYEHRIAWNEVCATL